MKNLSLLGLCLMLCSSELYPANVEEVLRFGDSLFFSNNYSYALLEYQRAFFFSEGNKKHQAAGKVAECHFLMEEFTRARAYYDSAICYSDSYLSTVDYELRKIACYILEGNFGYALLKLKDTDAVQDSALCYRKRLYMGICHFGMKQYDEAYSHLMASIPEEDTLSRNQLQIMFENRGSLNRPFPGLAMGLSIILPGAGQIYSGDIKDGINSISLLAVLTYIGISGSASGLVALLPFIYRYYIGGILNARNAAEYRQQMHQYYFYSKMLTILLK